MREPTRQRAETALLELADWRMAVLSRDAASLEGAVLDGRFAVGQTMARGGFATVFAGRDLVEERPCAVKIFRHELAEKSWMGRRFEQEVTALKQIRHVNVVGIYGHGTGAGRRTLLGDGMGGRRDAAGGFEPREVRSAAGGELFTADGLRAGGDSCTAHLPPRFEAGKFDDP